MPDIINETMRVVAERDQLASENTAQRGEIAALRTENTRLRHAFADEQVERFRVARHLADLQASIENVGAAALDTLRIARGEPTRVPVPKDAEVETSTGVLVGETFDPCATQSDLRPVLTDLDRSIADLTGRIAAERFNRREA